MDSDQDTTEDNAVVQDDPETEADPSPEAEAEASPEEDAPQPKPTDPNKSSFRKIGEFTEYYQMMLRISESLRLKAVAESIPLAYQRIWTEDSNAIFKMLVKHRHRLERVGHLLDNEEAADDQESPDEPSVPSSTESEDSAAGENEQDPDLGQSA